MANVQGAHAFTMNTGDLNNVSGDMHTHYHSHARVKLPHELDLNIYSEVDPNAAPTRIIYGPQMIPRSTDPSLPSNLRYTLLMFQEKQGYPLWFPEPNFQLPLEYKIEGLRIGDVGIVHHDKPFDFLFNITYPADHPINYRGVPAGFTQVRLEDLDINQVAEYRRNDSHIVRPMDVLSKSRVPNGNLEEGIHKSYQFSPAHSEAALLILPEGSSFATLESKAIFLNYAKENAKEWFSYAEEHRGRIFPSKNPSLYLITGWEKCFSWGISSLCIPNHISTKAVSLQFDVIGDFHFKYNWGHVTRFDESRCYPSTKSSGHGPIANQTVFAQGFKISKRRKKEKVKVRDITATTVNAEKVLDLPPGTFNSNSSYYSASGSSSSHGYGYSSGGYSQSTTLANPEDDIAIDDNSLQGQSTHNSTTVFFYTSDTTSHVSRIPIASFIDSSQQTTPASSAST
ncbi:hypothetical protein Moror_4339 [Moniliophthora roreri MCA 2997]|uniref:Uncharacterized protein n=1 Tax=Moniliophthora roreri (strain MCA 2997) TaxID=1381753 RepID=V2XII7_MONRO|nr:hypothetical protein Moror_4339 [Moniliophthora roreri MCA 2997]